MFKSGFGQQPAASGSSGFGFDNNQSRPSMFGQQQPASSFGAPAANTSTQNNASPFGMPSASPFGQPAAQPALGGIGGLGGGLGASTTSLGGLGGLGSNSMNSQLGGMNNGLNNNQMGMNNQLNNKTGTTRTPFTARETREKDPRTGDFKTERFQTITMMPEYQNHTIQELRVQDYEANVKGPNNAVGGGFGFGQSQPQTSGMFGSTQTAQNQGTSAFGNSAFGSTPQSSAGSGIFGQPAANSAQNSGFGGSSFGQPASQFGFNNNNNNNTNNTNNNNSSGGIFGQNNNSTSAFGKPASTGTSLFGQSQNQNQNPAQGSGTGQSSFGFGSTQNQSSPFGQNQNQNQPQSSPFGQSSTFGQKPGMFGNTQGSQTTGSSIFGNNSNNNAGSFGFQNNQNNQTQNTAQTQSGFGSQFGQSSFGQNQNTPATQNAGQNSQSTLGGGFGQSAFGQSNSNSFGSKPSMFGSTANSTTPATNSGGTGLFGKPAGPSLFGGSNTTTNNATTQSGFGFGQSNTPAGQNSQTQPGQAGQTGGMFGKPASSTFGQPQQTSLFGSSNSSTGNTSGGGLFGNNNNNNNNNNTNTTNNTNNTNTSNTGFSLGGANTSGGLFGNKPAAPSFGSSLNSKPSLFGSATNNSTNSGVSNPSATNTTNTNTGGLFGSSNSSSQLGGGGAAAKPSLFGSAPNPAPSTFGASTFGSSRPPNPTLFGSQPGPVASIDSNAYLNNPLFDTIRPATGVAEAQQPTVTPKKDSSNFKPPAGALMAQIMQPRALPKGKRIDAASSPPKPETAAVAALPAAKGSPSTNPNPSASNKFKAAQFKSALYSTGVDDIIMNSDAFDFTRHAPRIASVSTPTRAKKSPVPEEAFEIVSADISRIRGDADDEVEVEEIIDAPDVPDNEITDSHGYWISPSGRKLLNMTVRETRSVKNFRVGQRTMGFVEFLEPVDLSHFSNVQVQVCGRLVVFSDRSFVLYPEDSERPPVGQGFNVKYRVTLYNIFARSRETREVIKDAAHPIAKKFRKKLEVQNDLVSWSPQSGTWVFEVDPRKQ